MADEVKAPQSFAEFEAAQAAGHRLPPPQAEPAETSQPQGQDSEPETADPAAESEPEPEAAQTEKAKPAKHKATLTETRDQLAREVADLTKQQRDQLVQEVTELRKQRREMQQAAQPAVASTPGTNGRPEFPDLEDFKTLKEWHAAVRQYFVDDRAWGATEAQAQRVVAAYNAQAVEHIKEHPEYGAEITKLEARMPAHLVNLIFEQGPALGQALIDNPKEFDRIIQLPQQAAYFALGTLMAGRTNGNGRGGGGEAEEPEEEEKPVKVPAKVGASPSSPAVDKNDPTMGAKNFAQFEAITNRLREKRIAQYRGRR